MRTDRGPVPAGTGALTRRSWYVEARNGATRGLCAAVSYPPPHGACRSLVSALVWGTRGPEFKSRRPDSKAAAPGGFLLPVRTARFPNGHSRRHASANRPRGRVAHPQVYERLLAA